MGDLILPQIVKFLISYATETVSRKIFEFSQLADRKSESTNQSGYLCFCGKVRDTSICKSPVKKGKNRLP